MIILLLGLSFFISIISIFILLYVGIGSISPDSNIQIEAKLRKFLHKPAVIIIDPASYIRGRNSKFLRWFLVVLLIIKLSLYALLRTLSAN